MQDIVCEACGKASAKRDDILCLDCSRAYRILMDLFAEYPNLADADIGRIMKIYEWYSKKTEATISR